MQIFLFYYEHYSPQYERLYFIALNTLFVDNDSACSPIHLLPAYIELCLSSALGSRLWSRSAMEANHHLWTSRIVLGSNIQTGTCGRWYYETSPYMHK